MTDATLSDARRLGRRDYRTLALAALGGALEFYDFVIFVFFVAVLGELFFPPGVPDWLRQFQTFGIFAAGYLARPLGGIILAHFGDILGRKRMFALSILLMAVSTLGIGLLPTYETLGVVAPLLLLLFRVAQGAAIGGEVPGAWTFVAEHVPDRHVGYACGTLTCGLTAGILLGSLVATALNNIYSPQEVHDFAWRFPFILGGVFGLVAVYLRRWLEETPIFEEMKQKKALASELPLKTVVRNHRAAIVVSMLLTWVLSAAIVVVILMTPTFLQKQYGFTAVQSLEANSLATLCLSFGCVLAGWIVDKVGAGRFFIVGSLVLAAVTYVFYTQLHVHPEWLMPLYAITGFTVGTIGAVPFVMVKSFPAAVRFTGVSFAYNVSYAIFGGLTPMLLTLMLRNDPLAHAHYMLAICLIAFGTGVYLLRRKL
ncbi:MFS transporter [Terrihabitans sp. B22-R8]|uniref:MFS transporter n=1 Tax=Terrihabitans sp. B22-R8 TaxID=3425128 RepID=UPI00403CEC8B